MLLGIRGSHGLIRRGRAPVAARLSRATCMPVVSRRRRLAWMIEPGRVSRGRPLYSPIKSQARTSRNTARRTCSDGSEPRLEYVNASSPTRIPSSPPARARSSLQIDSRLDRKESDPVSESVAEREEAVVDSGTEVESVRDCGDPKSGRVASCVSLVASASRNRVSVWRSGVSDAWEWRLVSVMMRLMYASCRDWGQWIGFKRPWAELLPLPICPC